MEGFDAHFWFTVASFILSLLIATIVLFVVITQFYPAVIITIFHTISRIWLGLKWKRLKVKSTFTFHYLEKGNPKWPTLMLLHGFTSSKYMWFDVIKYLPCTNLNIISLDLPCHGESSVIEDCTVHKIVDLVHEFCLKTGLSKKRFHMAGISLGGLVAGLYASKYQDELISSILVCPSGIKSEENTKLEVEFVKGLGTKPAIFAQSVEEVEKFLLFVFHKKQSFPKIFLRAVLAEQEHRVENLKKVLALLLDERYKHALMPKMKFITMPTLVIWGRHDKILHVSGAEIMKKNIPNCRVEIVETSGHAVTTEDAEVSANLMSSFINQISSKK